MRKFLLVVVSALALGLWLRYKFHGKHEAPPAPAPVVTPTPQPPKPEPPPPPPPPQPPEPPKPPRIAGSTQISDAQVQWFATAPGVIYYCDAGGVMAQPKSGGPPQRLAECDGAFDFVADAEGVFYCNSNQLLRITAGTTGSHVVVDGVGCLMRALDGKYAYYVIPGFDDATNAGLYRVPRSGGTPQKIHATSPKEQYSVVVDDDAVWIAGWGFGTISKLAKTPGASAKTIVNGQKGIVGFATDATSLYWYAENTGELRRRKKAGGAIEVIGREVDQEPILNVDGHVYWFAGTGGQDKRLMHLAPGAAQPEVLAQGLHTPTMRADAEGVYISELDRDGIFMLKR